MAFTCKQETSDKRIANRSPYFTVLQYINNTETQTFPKMTFHRQESQFFLSIFYCFSNHKNFIPKYLDNSLKDFT